MLSCSRNDDDILPQIMHDPFLLVARRQRADDHIKVARAQRLAQHIVHADHDLESDAWSLCENGTADFRQEVLGRGRPRANADVAYGPVGKVANLPQDFVHGGSHAAGPLQEYGSNRGKLDASANATEQGSSDRCFQAMDAFGESRLCPS
jgi:hypothetical protein